MEIFRLSLSESRLVVVIVGGAVVSRKEKSVQELMKKRNITSLFFPSPNPYIPLQ